LHVTAYAGCGIPTSTPKMAPEVIAQLHEALAAIPDLRVILSVPLSGYTRFGVGGPADLLADAYSEDAFIAATRAVRQMGVPLEVIGGGTNLIVSDSGFRGVVLRFVVDRITVDATSIEVYAGASLQALVDASLEAGLAGIHTMTRIPGLVGAAVYGNAGAYGHSIHEWITEVRFFDGEVVRTFDNVSCEFKYRESRFKRHKAWTIFSARLTLIPGDPAELKSRAAEIQRIRDEKYPPTMMCAGSVFKNLLFANLPSGVGQAVPSSKVREGKVPSAHFLEEIGAKGMRIGSIVSADYHANLIYNAGGGTASEICQMIDELKARVRARFGFDLEEEVQYVGFDGSRRSY
jgi:UDP-N-acetylmuramate dehydrogenase